MRELFIYYRVRSDQADAALSAAIAFQSGLRQAFPELRTRLLRRAEETSDGRQTWMETYATDPMQTPQGISAALEARINQNAQALRPFIDGTRHTEAFVACAS